MLHLNNYIRRIIVFAFFNYWFLGIYSQSPTLSITNEGFHIVSDTMSDDNMKYINSILNNVFCDSTIVCKTPNSLDSTVIIDFIYALFVDSAIYTPIVELWSKDYYVDYAPIVLTKISSPMIRQTITNRLMNSQNTMWHLAYWQNNAYYEYDNYNAYRNNMLRDENILVLSELYALAVNNKIYVESCLLRSKLRRLGYKLSSAYRYKKNIDYFDCQYLFIHSRNIE